MESATYWGPEPLSLSIRPMPPDWNTVTGYTDVLPCESVKFPQTQLPFSVLRNLFFCLLFEVHKFSWQYGVLQHAAEVVTFAYKQRTAGIMPEDGLCIAVHREKLGMT